MRRCAAGCLHPLQRRLRSDAGWSREGVRLRRRCDELWPRCCWRAVNPHNLTRSQLLAEQLGDRDELVAPGAEGVDLVRQRGERLRAVTAAVVLDHDRSRACVVSRSWIDCSCATCTAISM